VTWATSVLILVFLGLSVLDLGPMYATDRQTDVRHHHRLMPPPIRGGDIIVIPTSVRDAVSALELNVRRWQWVRTVNGCYC